MKHFYRTHALPDAILNQRPRRQAEFGVIPIGAGANTIPQVLMMGFLGRTVVPNVFKDAAHIRSKILCLRFVQRILGNWDIRQVWSEVKFW